MEAHLFRSIVISTKHEIGKSLTSALEATGHVDIARKIDGYPEAADLLRSVRANAAEIVFVDLQNAAHNVCTINSREHVMEKSAYVLHCRRRAFPNEDIHHVVT